MQEKSKNSRIQGPIAQQQGSVKRMLPKRECEKNVTKDCPPQPHPNPKAQPQGNASKLRRFPAPPISKSQSTRKCEGNITKHHRSVAHPNPKKNSHKKQAQVFSKTKGPLCKTRERACEPLLCFSWNCSYILRTGNHFEPARSYLRSTTT